MGMAERDANGRNDKILGGPRIAICLEMGKRICRSAASGARITWFQRLMRAARRHAGGVLCRFFAEAE